MSRPVNDGEETLAFNVENFLLGAGPRDVESIRLDWGPFK
jgi:hypothetical protein